MKKRNQAVLYWFIGAIVVLALVLGFLLATGKLDFALQKGNTASEPQSLSSATVSDAYQAFVRDKQYENQLDDSDRDTVNAAQYTTYDLDKNGVEELVIYLSNDTDFGKVLFYTYDGNAVTFIDKISCFGNLTYYAQEKSIVYTDVRPSAAYGAAYGFYRLENGALVLNKTLVEEIDNGESRYFVAERAGDQTEITEAEYHGYFDDNIRFESRYIEIK